MSPVSAATTYPTIGLNEQKLVAIYPVEWNYSFTAPESKDYNIAVKKMGGPYGDVISTLKVYNAQNELLGTVTNRNLSELVLSLNQGETYRIHATLDYGIYGYAYITEALNP